MNEDADLNVVLPDLIDVVEEAVIDGRKVTRTIKAAKEPRRLWLLGQVAPDHDVPGEGDFVAPYVHKDQQESQRNVFPFHDITDFAAVNAMLHTDWWEADIPMPLAVMGGTGVTPSAIQNSIEAMIGVAPLGLARPTDPTAEPTYGSDLKVITDVSERLRVKLANTERLRMETLEQILNPSDEASRIPENVALLELIKSRRKSQKRTD